ncbi:MAG TPA: hypothetical protein VJA21_03290 [Verrucomicrobiae bacterium]
MESGEITPFAWQPMTPAGVAAFASASLRRLWLVQFVIAVLAAAVVLWFLHADWFPVIQTAIRRLPTQGEVRSGRLLWQGNSPVTLAENHFLALSIDLRHEGGARSPAHLQAEFGERDFVLLSLFGVVQTPYPRGYTIAFNRDELEPWWGAWRPAILAMTALSVIVGLMLCWALLALVYTPGAWLLAFFANRDLTLPGSYRLCGAGLIPGALFMTAVMVLYGVGTLDVLLLLIMTATHFVIGWIYVILGSFRRPRIREATTRTGNPFGEEKKEGN